jgi:hypothetical protein
MLLQGFDFINKSSHYKSDSREESDDLFILFFNILNKNYR